MKVFILYSIALLTFWDLRNANTNQPSAGPDPQCGLAMINMRPEDNSYCDVCN